MEPLRSITDILNYAIEREIESKKFYDQLTQRIEKKEVRKVIKNFALDEYQHKLRLEDIRDSKISFTDDDAGSLGLTNCLDDVEPHAEMSYKELLAFGIRKEDKSYRLYTQLAQYSKSMKFKEVFSQLAQEEAHHRLNLELEYDLTSF